MADLYEICISCAGGGCPHHFSKCPKMIYVYTEVTKPSSVVIMMGGRRKSGDGNMGQ